MSSFNQLAPSVPTILNTSNCFIFSNSSSGNALSVQQLGAGNVASFRTTTGATALFINPAGNVGVGTTNPGTFLHVQGATNVGGQKGSPSSNTVASFLNDLTYATNEAVDIEIGSQSRQTGNFGSVYKYRLGVINGGTAYSSSFYINAVPSAAGAYTSDGTALNRMTIRYDGNVGIGVVSPLQTLHVYSGAAGNPTGGAGTGADSNAAVRIQMQTVGIDIGTTGAGATWFQNRQPATSLSTVLPISLNPIGGNVGIGLTNPSHQLTVTSNIYNYSSGGGFYGMNCGNLNGLIQGIYNGGTANPDGLNNSDMFIGVNYDQQTGQRLAGTNHGVAQIQLVGGNNLAGALKFKCLTAGTGAVATIPTIATISTTGLIVNGSIGMVGGTTIPVTLPAVGSQTSYSVNLPASAAWYTVISDVRINATITGAIGVSDLTSTIFIATLYANGGVNASMVLVAGSASNIRVSGTALQFLATYGLYGRDCSFTLLRHS